MPGMPLESLVQLGTVGDSDPAMDASCCVGDFVITLNDSKALPFVMGQVVDVDGDSGMFSGGTRENQKKPTSKLVERRRSWICLVDGSPQLTFLLANSSPCRHRW